MSWWTVWIVPDALAGLDVEREDARAEQVVAGPEAAEEVDRRRIGRNVDEPALGVGRHRRPRRDVAGPLPRVVLPRLVTELPGPRNDVELPEVLPAPGVIREDVARDVLDARLVVALLVHVAHHHDAVHDDGRRRGREVAQLTGNALLRVVLETRLRPGCPVLHEIGKHVDHAAPREAGHRHARAPVLEVLARLGVERVQEERGRRVVDDASSVHLRVRDPLPVVVAHAALVPRRVGLAVGPQRLSRCRVDGRDGAPLARHGEEDSIHVDRRRAEDVVDPGPEVVAAPDPRHLELLEIGGVDLVERQVPRVRGITADVAPLASRGATLLRDGRQRPGEDAEGTRQAHAHPPPPGCLACSCVHRLVLQLDRCSRSRATGSHKAATHNAACILVPRLSTFPVGFGCPRTA